jgi:hypothetical protein
MATDNRKSPPKTHQVLPETAKQGERRAADPRFRQLCALASEGNAEAVADLWREYGFRFGEDEP